MARGHEEEVAAEVSPLILLAALSNLLLQEIERSGYRQLADERLMTELRVFAARVETELAAATDRPHLHLAGDDPSRVTDD